MRLTSSPRRAQLASLALGCALLAACGSSGGTPEPPIVPPDALPEFSYPTRVLLAELGVAMAPQVPTASGTAPIDAWALEGSLPAGVVFDPSDGSFSGTPGELASPRALAVTATNDDGIFVQRLSLSVHGPTRFAYSANAGDNTLTKLVANDALGTFEHDGYLLQTPGEANPQDVQADPRGRLVYALNSFAITPYLVDALSGSLTAATPVALGNGPHSLYVHPGGEFLYITSQPTDRIRAYAVDATSGTLTLIEQVTTAVGPNDIAGDPNGRYLIVGHESSEVLQSFLIDPVSGGLTLSGTTDLPGVVTPDIELGPLGEALYVVLQQPFGGLLRCSVDTATGIATLGPVTNLGSEPRSIVVEPGRRFAYVLNDGTTTITYFSVADKNGNLTKVGDLPSTAGTVSLRFTPDGRRALSVDQLERLVHFHDLEADGSLTETSAARLRQLPKALALVEGSAAPTRVTDVMYVLSDISDGITVFQVDAVTGLVDDGGLPAVPTGSGPVDLALDPTGRFAFVSNALDQTITVYAMQPNGDLVDNLTTLNLTAAPSELAVDPTGRFLYIALETFGLLGMYSIDSGGSLAFIGTRQLLLVPEQLVFDPAGLYLYAVHGGDRITQFGSFRAFLADVQTGVLTPVDPLIDANAHPTVLEFSDGGRRAYAPLKVGDIVIPWDVAADGLLAPVLPGSSTQNEPVDIALTPDQKFAFVACNDSTALGSLLLYDVDPSDGRLFNSTNGTPTWRNAISVGLNPVAVETSLDGQFVYVLSETSAQLRVLSIDPDTGFLTELQTVTRGAHPIVLRRRILIQ